MLFCDQNNSVRDRETGCKRETDIETDYFQSEGGAYRENFCFTIKLHQTSQTQNNKSFVLSDPEQ